MVRETLTPAGKSDSGGFQVVTLKVKVTSIKKNDALLVPFLPLLHETRCTM